MDGVAGLEGRFRKIESCGESLFVHVVMIADGGVLMWRGRESECCCRNRRVESILTCGHIEVSYCFITVDGMLSVWMCVGRWMR
jgi:hypothetical protein